MPSTNGHGPKTAVLYTRVSTDEQARSGYSLAQQMEALRDFAVREGYEVLEEVSDPGQSGASLERPGMDRVRDLVAAGGVSVVLAQDRDRFSREPAYSYLLRREFEERGATLRSMNDRGDESPEGELTDGILDQLAKYERAKIAERSRRGRLRKAREGKLLRTGRANYGFSHDESGNHYVINEEEMPTVRRIFGMVVSGDTLYGVKRTLEREGVPPPANGEKGGKYWSASYLRTLVMDDVYLPLPHAEVSGLVSADVAARLDASKCYGVFWFNRTRTTRKRVRVPGADGNEYKWRYSVAHNPRDQWVAIPVPDSGVGPDIVKAARGMIAGNRQKTSTGRRFWELPGGSVRCAGCGCRMTQYTSAAAGRNYSYYRCSRLARLGKDSCPSLEGRKNHRAELVEKAVWDFIAGLLKDPDRLRAGLDAMIEEEKAAHRGGPATEQKAWLEKLAAVAEERRGYLRLAATGRITDAELDTAVAELEEAREEAERELAALQGRQEAIANLERDRDALMGHYAGLVPEALDQLSAEERQRVYRILRIGVAVRSNSDLEVSGVFGDAASFSTDEFVSRYRP